MPGATTRSKSYNLYYSFGPVFNIRRDLTEVESRRFTGIVFIRKFNIPLNCNAVWSFFNFYNYFVKLEEPLEREISKVERFFKKHGLAKDVGRFFKQGDNNDIQRH